MENLKNNSKHSECQSAFISSFYVVYEAYFDLLIVLKCFLVLLRGALLAGHILCAIRNNQTRYVQLRGLYLNESA